MPVLTKGEFTVSRLDDGQTPVVHPGWSWSPDGTDRFTTVYPRENLITESLSGKFPKIENINQVSPKTFTELNEEGALVFGANQGETVTPYYFAGAFGTTTDILGESYLTKLRGKQVVASANVEVDIGNATITANQVALSIYSWDTDGTNSQPTVRKTKFEEELLSVDAQLPDDLANILVAVRTYASSGKTFDGAKILVNSMKLEIVDDDDASPTIYTPAPSEDYANAYPLYEGTYTDYSETASQNPADYTWRRIIGESGQDGVAGSDGKGIKSTAVSYQASTSGTTAPTGTWVANPPTVAKGQYLWTRTIWTYTDNATETGYSVAYVAKDGNDGSDGIAGKDGVGIKSTSITYAVSSSGTTAPTSGWVVSPPTATAGQFMWTRTVWTYTDNTTETGYSVGKIGDTGATGPQGPQGITGPKGEDGKQYYTWLKYADSPTTGMSDSPTNKKYMGLAYNKTTATESTNYADYTWSLIQGPQGNQGIQGPAGANGQPTYTWIKYGTSASGAGLSDDPTGKTYIGMAYNKTTATESTNAADYTWSLIQGPKGDTGSNGISVTSVTEEYYVSTSATTQTGGAWSTTVPNNANPNLYVWRRVKNTMSDGTFSYTTPALIQGMTGIYPYIGPTQPANPKEGQQWWKSDSNGNVTDFYVYHDGSWQGQTIQQSVLNILELNAVDINGSNVTGTHISGSEFVNDFDTPVFDDNQLYIYGTTTIGDAGILIDSDYYWASTGKPEAGGNYEPKRVEISAKRGGLYVSRDFTQSPEYGRWIQVDDNGIKMYDGDYAMRFSTGAVNLRYQDFMTVPATQLSPETNYSVYATSGNSQPVASRNGRSVQLSGAFKPNVAMAASSSPVKMGSLPIWARPAAAVTAIAQGSGMNRFLLQIESNGDITWQRYGTSSSVDVPAGAWLNISCTYSAADL